MKVSTLDDLKLTYPEYTWRNNFMNLDEIEWTTAANILHTTDVSITDTDY
jgi:hypothetical protein